MNRKSVLTVGMATIWLAGLVLYAMAGQDKYTVKVPGGLAFSEFKGYEAWQAIGFSRNDKVAAIILGNPVMIEAYAAGIPANGKPVPDGAKMAKIHWLPKQNQSFPETTGPGALLNVDFMEKDSKRFADSAGWGWAAFEYDAKSDTFKPATTASTPPQGNDAKCGLGCHTIAKNRDYVFTEYGKR
jgi:Cytochrome P460